MPITENTIMMALGGVSADCPDLEEIMLELLLHPDFCRVMAECIEQFKDHPPRGR